MYLFGKSKLPPPKGNSTPKLVQITCRRSIKDMDNLPVSPIGQKRSPAKKSSLNSSNEKHELSPRHERLLGDIDKASDDSEYDSSVSDTTTGSEDSRVTRARIEANKQPLNVLGSFFGYHLIVIIVLGGIVFTLSKAIDSFGEQHKNEVTMNIDDIMREFPSQTPEFWLSLDSAIRDVNRLKKPSTFLLFHDQSSRHTARKLLEKVSKYTACRIKNCKVEPIKVNGEEWKSVKDHGVLLEKYLIPLRDKGVMVVEDIQKLNGNVAQVFHSLCDEFSPLVREAVIFLTVEIHPWKNIEGDNLGQYLDNYLRPAWSSINNEKFYPLFTRISNIVLQIIEEKP